jgi:repressor of nif and glnA expression
MRQNHPKEKVAILRVLRDADRPLGGDAIAQAIQAYGLDLSGRTVRLYLKEMEQEGLVGPAGRGRRGGRTITELGLEEIKHALIFDRVGFTAAKVDELACRMTFDLPSRRGLIVLNVTTLEEKHLPQAIRAMVPVFHAGLGMGNCVAVVRPGERMGDYQVPRGKVGIGTVCSVTFNGVLLKAGIPTVSRFGGVLELREGKPVRFTDVIYYDGTSLDPLEVFIKGGLTDVRDASRNGHGRIGASFREVPTAALRQVEKISRELALIGLGGVLLVGKPNQPLLDFPVHEGRTAVILTGGLNPAAALQEAGIESDSVALGALYEFERLIHYQRLVEEAAQR